MRPLLMAAFYTGLCPLGRPPYYKPSWGSVSYSLFVTTMWIVLIFGFLGKELFAAYNIDIAFFGSGAPPPDEDEEEIVNDSQTRLRRAITLTIGAALIVTNTGLLIGFFRKLRHLPDVFRLGDELPGKARWRTALFVAELFVYCVPPSGWAVKSYFASRGLSDVDVFAVVGMLITVEKFMILHLVARVGIGFDFVNKRLEAVGRPQREATAAWGARGRRKEESISDTIVELRQQHLRLCDLLERTVRAYEVQMLSFLVGEFVTAVLVIYAEARSMYLGTLSPMDMLAVLFMVLITQITTLLYGTCRSTSNKGNTTLTIVHNLLNSKRFQEDEVLQQLMTFSMQLGHLQVSVSPYDMVTMDYSLLQAMLANVAMHIVVLVQFTMLSGSS